LKQADSESMPFSVLLDGVFRQIIAEFQQECIQYFNNRIKWSMTLNEMKALEELFRITSHKTEAISPLQFKFIDTLIPFLNDIEQPNYNEYQKAKLFSALKFTRALTSYHHSSITDIKEFYVLRQQLAEIEEMFFAITYNSDMLDLLYKIQKILYILSLESTEKAIKDYLKEDKIISLQTIEEIESSSPTDLVRMNPFLFKAKFSKEAIKLALMEINESGMKNLESNSKLSVIIETIYETFEIVMNDMIIIMNESDIKTILQNLSDILSSKNSDKNTPDSPIDLNKTSYYSEYNTIVENNVLRLAGPSFDIFSLLEAASEYNACFGHKKYNWKLKTIAFLRDRVRGRHLNLWVAMKQFFDDVEQHFPGIENDYSGRKIIWPTEEDIETIILRSIKLKYYQTMHLLNDVLAGKDDKYLRDEDINADYLIRLMQNDRHQNNLQNIAENITSLTNNIKQNQKKLMLFTALNELQFIADRKEPLTYVEDAVEVLRRSGIVLSRMKKSPQKTQWKHELSYLETILRFAAKEFDPPNYNNYINFTKMQFDNTASSVKIPYTRQIMLELKDKISAIADYLKIKSGTLYMLFFDIQPDNTPHSSVLPGNLNEKTDKYMNTIPANTDNNTIDNAPFTAFITAA
jgi:hypothetical protein